MWLWGVGGEGGRRVSWCLDWCQQCGERTWNRSAMGSRKGPEGLHPRQQPRFAAVTQGVPATHGPCIRCPHPSPPCRMRHPAPSAAPSTWPSSSTSATWTPPTSTSWCASRAWSRAHRRSSPTSGALRVGTDIAGAGTVPPAHSTPALAHAAPALCPALHPPSLSSNQLPSCHIRTTLSPHPPRRRKLIAG